MAFISDLKEDAVVFYEISQYLDVKTEINPAEKILKLWIKKNTPIKDLVSMLNVFLLKEVKNYIRMLNILNKISDYRIDFKIEMIPLMMSTLFNAKTEENEQDINSKLMDLIMFCRNSKLLNQEIALHELHFLMQTNSDDKKRISDLNLYVKKTAS